MKKALLGGCMITALTVACGADQPDMSTMSGHPAVDVETAGIRLAFSQARMVSTGAELMPGAVWTCYIHSATGHGRFVSPSNITFALQQNGKYHRINLEDGSNVRVKWNNPRTRSGAMYSLPDANVPGAMVDLHLRTKLGPQGQTRLYIEYLQVPGIARSYSQAITPPGLRRGGQNPSHYGYCDLQAQGIGGPGNGLEPVPGSGHPVIIEGGEHPGGGHGAHGGPIPQNSGETIVPGSIRPLPGGPALPGSTLPGSATPGSPIPGSALPGSTLPGSGTLTPGPSSGSSLPNGHLPPALPAPANGPSYQGDIPPSTGPIYAPSTGPSAPPYDGQGTVVPGSITPGRVIPNGVPPISGPSSGLSSPSNGSGVPALSPNSGPSNGLDAPSLAPNSGSSSGLLDAPPLPGPPPSSDLGGETSTRTQSGGLIAPPSGSRGSILRVDPSQPSFDLPGGVTPVPAPLPLPIEAPPSSSDGPLPPPPSALEAGPEEDLPPADFELGNGDRVANDDDEFLPYGLNEEF